MEDSVEIADSCLFSCCLEVLIPGILLRSSTVHGLVGGKRKQQLCRSWVSGMGKRQWLDHA